MSFRVVGKEGDGLCSEYSEFRAREFCGKRTILRCCVVGDVDCKNFSVIIHTPLHYSADHGVYRANHTRSMFPPKHAKEEYPTVELARIQDYTSEAAQ